MVALLVKEIMTKNVITIDKNKTILDACNKYRDFKVGCLIVKDNEECVGILTERDIIERTICQNIDPKSTLVSEIMSSDIKTIHALATIETTIECMKKYDIKKLPVVTKEGIVGIITVTDISRARPDLSKRFIESWVKPVWVD